MKGLICGIYQDKSIGNCSNGGISQFLTRVTLVGPGIAEIFEPTVDAPAVVLRSVSIGSNDEHVYAVPLSLLPGVVPVKGEGRPSMMGGCFIFSSDGRFPSRQPIPLHDRQENGPRFAFD